ncbi:MAG: hypothetical protein GKR95_06605 [Gammaproteobacteria bacterium]|nr:hypothetical protein [Gammaproteobacteria bacterium]
MSTIGSQGVFVDTHPEISKLNDKINGGINSKVKNQKRTFITFTFQCMGLGMGMGK